MYILRIAFGFLFLATMTAQARLVPDSSELATKVTRSDFVALVEAVKVTRPKPAAPGLHEFAVLRVISAVKGSPPAEVLFVTRGFISEADPTCCVVGKRYVVFLKRGYPVFDTRDGKDEIILLGLDEYVSPGDSAHSTYEVEDGRVKNWKHVGDEGTPLCDVLEQIRLVMESEPSN